MVSSRKWFDRLGIFFSFLRFLVLDVGILAAVLLCICMHSLFLAPRYPIHSLQSAGAATFSQPMDGWPKHRAVSTTDHPFSNSPLSKNDSYGILAHEQGTNLSLHSSHADPNPSHNPSRLRETAEGRLKVYVYDLPPVYNTRFVKKDRRCLTHMFATEIFFHDNILKSPVRTLNPEEADWFYAPVYTTCDLTPSGLPLPFRSPRQMRSALKYISMKWPYWNRSEGADHFFIVPHDFGACFHYQEEKAIGRGIMPLLQRATLVQTFGQRHHVCMKEGSIVVPPYAPPRHIRAHIIPPTTPRGIFVYFRGLFYDVGNDPEGGYYARGARASVWENFKNNPLFDISTSHPTTYYEDMQRSVFCLCPLGWAPWSPRIVESIVFGCIPVIIADDIVLPFQYAIPWQEISVFVAEKDVPQLDSILTSIGSEQILEMQRKLADPAMKAAMLFPSPPEAGDAFHQVLNGLARKLPHPPGTFLEPGAQMLNWSAGPKQDFKPWKPDSHVYW